jgi:hypothetical protein
VQATATPDQAAPKESETSIRLSSASQADVIQALDRNRIPWFQNDEGVLSFSTGSPHLRVEITYRDSVSRVLAITFEDSSSEVDADIVSAADMLINSDGSFTLEFKKLTPFVPQVDESSIYSPF